MANSYSQCTPECVLKATKKEAENLIKLAQYTEEQEDAGEYHGFSFEYYNGFYMYAEDNFDVSYFGTDFLKALGKLIKKNKMEYLLFGYAYTCSKLRPGEFGGGEFRIYTDGKIKYPTIIWPRKKEIKK